LPSREEIEGALKYLKNNKAASADSIAVELLKNGGPNLVDALHAVIQQAWTSETVLRSWTEGILCPVFKKEGKLDCKNYRGICLLNVTYKVFAKILYDCLLLHNAVQHYSIITAGFHPGKSTTDQLFALRQILEKYNEFNITTHHLFIDFKAAYETIIRNEIYDSPNALNVTKTSILRYVGHIIRRPEGLLQRALFRAKRNGRRNQGRPKSKCADGVNSNSLALGVRDWTHCA
jgi:hypothetical protein